MCSVNHKQILVAITSSVQTITSSLHWVIMHLVISPNLDWIIDLRCSDYWLEGLFNVTRTVMFVLLLLYVFCLQGPPQYWSHQNIQHTAYCVLCSSSVDPPGIKMWHWCVTLKVFNDKCEAGQVLGEKTGDLWAVGQRHYSAKVAFDGFLVKKSLYFHIQLTKTNCVYDWDWTNLLNAFLFSLILNVYSDNRWYQSSTHPFS